MDMVSGVGNKIQVSATAPQIIVGTHALYATPADWRIFGLVVIDEQHKFGVLQRARLIARGDARMSSS